MWGIVTVAVVLRLLLSLLNREANDDHVMVANLIEGLDFAAPPRDACQPCYHAKLYHYTCAGLFRALSIESDRARIMVSNLVNFVAGLGFLAVVWQFIRTLSWQPVTRLLVFATVALCPTFLVIASQATNDSFAILFGTIAIYAAWLYCDRPTWGRLVSVGTAVVLTASTKTGGWVLFAMLVIFFGVKLAAGGFRERWWRRGLAFLLVSFLVVPFEQPYRTYIQVHHTPFMKSAFDLDIEPLRFFEPTSTPRPGLRSYVQGFGTFPLWLMLKEPAIVDGAAPLPKYRVSFWANVYGRLWFTRFDQWPPTWQTRDAVTFTIGRTALALGLLPTAALLVGMFRHLETLARGLRRDGASHLTKVHEWLFPLAWATFGAMFIQMAVKFREFTWFKPIYVLPAALGFVVAFGDGLEELQKAHWARRIVRAWMTVLLIVFVVDVAWLVFQLWRARGGPIAASP